MCREQMQKIARSYKRDSNFVICVGENLTREKLSINKDERGGNTIEDLSIIQWNSML